MCLSLFCLRCYILVNITAFILPPALKFCIVLIVSNSITVMMIEIANILKQFKHTLYTFYIVIKTNL